MKNPDQEGDDESRETPETLDQGSGPVNKVSHRSGVSRWTLAPFNRAVVIGNQPSRRSRIVSKSGNQMQMEVAGPLAKSNRVHPITSRELAHQLAGLLDCLTPRRCLIGGEVGRSTHMAERVEKQPTFQGRRIRVMAQHPKRCPSNLIATQRSPNRAVQLADAAACRGSPREQNAKPPQEPRSPIAQPEQARKPKEAKRNRLSRPILKQI